jgi:hypothetical protein
MNGPSTEILRARSTSSRRRQDCSSKRMSGFSIWRLRIYFKAEGQDRLFYEIAGHCPELVMSDVGDCECISGE